MSKTPNIIDARQALIQQAQAVVARVFRVYNAEYIQHCLANEPDSLLAIVKRLDYLIHAVLAIEAAPLPDPPPSPPSPFPPNRTIREGD